MAQSTLALSYDEIRQRVAKDYGYRTTIADWTDQEIEDIEFSVRDGCDLFYTKSGHEWSFLEPFATITFLEGESEIELPWDFGFPIDQTIYFDDNAGCVCELVNDGTILLARQNAGSTSGRPMQAAIVVDTKPGFNVGQRWKLIYWPEANEDLDAQIRYSILPAALAPIAPMPYGGAAHAGTLMQACLAAKERRDGNPQGPHNQTYAVMLEASKQYDRRVKPRVLRGKGQLRRGRVSNIVTYVPGP